MRKYDIAYVPNGANSYYPTKNLQDMTYDEIVKKYIKTCGKANGDTAVCSKCQSPCREGKRAIQLLANEVYNDPPVPLYAGKTMIDWAKAENERRRLWGDKNPGEITPKADSSEKEKKEPKKRHFVQLPSDWYQQAVDSGDPTQWLMEHSGLSKSKAQKKINSYRYNNGLTHKDCVNTREASVNETVVKSEPKKENESETTQIETKMEKLMQELEKYEEEMVKHQKLYNEAKQKYDEINKKVEVLCNAIDIVNEK